ncbi:MULTISPECIES: hypothetical protein [Cyanophyceae]|nr:MULTISPECIES: hypothetical protein [Cyanophyceae]
MAMFLLGLHQMAAIIPFAGYIVVFTGIALAGFLGLRAANII